MRPPMLRTRKITISFFILTALIVVSGLGCKGQTAAEQAATKPITLEYWTVFDDVDTLRALITQYKATRPYLNVTIRQLRTDEIYDRFVEELAEDRGPDIISVNNRQLGIYQSKLSTLPASVNDTTIVVTKGTLGDKTTVNQRTLPTLSVDQLDREYVQAVRQDVVRAGVIYGLPISFDTMALYYNKDLLDRAGIPEPPKTWEEFQEAVKKLTKYDRATGKIAQSGAALGTGANVPGSEDILYILFRQSNLAFADRSGRAVFNGGGTRRGEQTAPMTIMDFYTDFANPGRDTYSWNDTMPNALDSFVNGTTAFFFGYSFQNQVIKTRAPQLNYDIIPLPQLSADSPANTAYYWLQAVPEKSTHKNEAWSLVMYLTHSAVVKDYLDKTGRPTALRAYIGAQKEKKELDPFVSQILVAGNWYRGRDYTAAQKAVHDMMKEWLTPPPDPDRALEYKQEILDRAAAKINQTL